MTTPAVRALQRAVGGRRITMLTSSAGAEVARMVPEIGEVLVYEAPWMKATPHPAKPATDFCEIEALRTKVFDAAVIFTVYSQNPLPAALLCYLAGIPLRAAHCRENPYQLLTDWIPDPEPHHQIRHEVERQLALVAALGARAPDTHLSLSILQAARDRVAQLLARLDFDAHQDWVAIHPGCTAASRRYPPEQFAAVVRILVRQYGIPVLFTGTSEDVPLVEQIRDASGVSTQSLVNSLPLPEFAALLAAAPLLLSNNSGPVHVAASVGTPVVDLYALTNPQHTPWEVPNRVLSHDVPCKYCYKSICPFGHNDCLARIEPETVVAAVLSLLAETRTRAGETSA